MTETFSSEVRLNELCLLVNGAGGQASRNTAGGRPPAYPKISVPMGQP